MLNDVMKHNFINIILEAQNADANQLAALRKKIFTAVEKFGAKRFVTVTAEVLKDNFCIEGCNDARISLKRIFDTSLDELIDWLEKKDYRLPRGHPIILLSQDHRDNVNRLNALATTLKSFNRNGSSAGNEWHHHLSDISEYYGELDAHIRKEEEIFFPQLEKEGMKEHPENLRQEHKEFRQILSQLIDVHREESLASESLRQAIGTFLNKFVPKIANHILRETYIFYPAALEYIKDTDNWEEIKEEFQAQEDRYIIL